MGVPPRLTGVLGGMSRQNSSGERLGPNLTLFRCPSERGDFDFLAELLVECGCLKEGGNCLGVCIVVECLGEDLLFGGVGDFTNRCDRLGAGDSLDVS